MTNPILYTNNAQKQNIVFKVITYFISNTRFFSLKKKFYISKLWRKKMLEEIFETETNKRAMKYIKTY